VLPFVNLSSDREQEYFSDGIAEELLDALARVKGLKVAGRTASFYFKGKKELLQTIGRSLGVENILEGSVRKQGNRVRITAQLTRVSDGTHRWSRSFDGELIDVFDLQEKIARAITDELEVVLRGPEREALIPVATKDPEAYALHLQASAIFNRRDGERFPDAIAQLEQALRRDPGFARAWSRLGALRAVTPNYGRGDFDASLASAEEAARRAIELDPAFAEPHAVLGRVFAFRRHFLDARAALTRALEIDPDDVTALHWFGLDRAILGYRRESNRLLDRLLAIDPMFPNALTWRAEGALADGDIDLAERLAGRARDAGLSYAGLSLSWVAEARGRPHEAAVQLAEGLAPLASEFPLRTLEAIARGTFGDASARVEALADIRRYLASAPRIPSGVAAYALIRLGEPAEALELLARGPTKNDVIPFGTLWGPNGREARALPEFSEAVRRFGFVEVWEREGPPDLCDRVSPGRYACR